MNYYEQAVQVAKKLKDLEREQQLEREKKYKELSEVRFEKYVEIEKALKDFDQKVLKTREVLKFDRLPGTQVLKLNIQGSVNKNQAVFEIYIDEKENKVLIKCQTWDKLNKRIEFVSDKPDLIMAKFIEFLAPFLLV